MADVLWRKVQEGRQPAWNYLGRVARKGSANAHHCSIMLRVCDNAEDLQRLEDYIAEQDIAVDDVLLRQLHQAWLQACRPGRAVRCLMSAATDRAAAEALADAALAGLLRRKDTAGATDYLTGLVVAGVAIPRHLWLILRALGPDQAGRRQYLVENLHKLTPTRLSGSSDGGDGNTERKTTPDLEWESDWIAALHSGLVNAGAAPEGSDLLCRAVEAGLLSVETARRHSVRQISRLQQRRADVCREAGAITYLAALHRTGLMTAEHFAAALSHARTVVEGRKLLEQARSLGVAPDRDIAVAFHDLLLLQVHERTDTVDSVQPLWTKISDQPEYGREVGKMTDGVEEAATWLSSCVENGRALSVQSMLALNHAYFARIDYISIVRRRYRV